MNKRLMDVCRKIPCLKEYVPADNPTTFADVVELWGKSIVSKQQHNYGVFTQKLQAMQVNYLHDAVNKSVVFSILCKQYGDDFINDFVNDAAKEFIRSCESLDFTPGEADIIDKFDKDMETQIRQIVSWIVKDSYRLHGDVHLSQTNTELAARTVVYNVGRSEFLHFMATRKQDIRKKNAENWKWFWAALFGACLGKFVEWLYGLIVHDAVQVHLTNGFS